MRGWEICPSTIIFSKLVIIGENCVNIDRISEYGDIAKW